MTREEINKLLSTGEFPDECPSPHLIETHISWVLICHTFVFKIKKPLHYSFLDFSTIEKRKFYCEREVTLNRRLTGDMYKDVQVVKKAGNHFFIGPGEGETVDYAVRMNKMDRSRQMDILLMKHKVTLSDIMSLANHISAFHKTTQVIYNKNTSEVQEKFRDLEKEAGFLKKHLPSGSDETIMTAIEASDKFLRKSKDLVNSRLEAGFYRDCHGDLHSRNIFLLQEPVIFDCIEFNDDYRQIDVLNEIAFFCMDLDAFGQEKLSEFFIEQYNYLLPAIRTPAEKQLFIYYKSYRANVRAKVNSLIARSAIPPSQQKTALSETDKYLRLMSRYIEMLGQ